MHDLLSFLVKMHLDDPIFALTRYLSPLAVLCWLLGHDHSNIFDALIGSLEDELEENGAHYDPATRQVYVAETVEVQ